MGSLTTAAAGLQTFTAAELTMYQDNYRYAIKPFVQYLSGNAVTMEGIRGYFQELNASDLSASSIRVRRQAVVDRVRRRFAHSDSETRTQVERSLTEMNRDPDLKAPSAQIKTVGANKVLSDREYLTVLQKARSARQRCFVEFLHTTGARVSEMTAVKLSDCKQQGTVVTVRLKGKGNARSAWKEREVFISSALYQRIQDTFTSSSYLFQTSNGNRYTRQYISGQIAKLTTYAIGRPLSAHKMRHSFATSQMKKHGRLTAVSRYLGHSDITITARYYDHDSLSAGDVLGADAVV